MEFGFATVGSQPFTSQGREGEDEAGKSVKFKREDVEIEEKWLAGLDRPAVEMAGAEDKGTGRISESAGPGTVGDRFEDFGAGTGVPDFTGTGVT